MKYWLIGQLPRRVFLPMMIACGVAVACERSAEPPEGEPSGARVLMEFEAIVDSRAGTIEMVRNFDTVQRGVSPVNVVQNGVPGGPTDSVELITESTDFDAACGST